MSLRRRDCVVLRTRARPGRARQSGDAFLQMRAMPGHAGGTAARGSGPRCRHRSDRPLCRGDTQGGIRLGGLPRALARNQACMADCRGLHGSHRDARGRDRRWHAGIPGQLWAAERTAGRPELLAAAASFSQSASRLLRLQPTPIWRSTTTRWIRNLWCRPSPPSRSRLSRPRPRSRRPQPARDLPRRGMAARLAALPAVPLGLTRDL